MIRFLADENLDRAIVLGFRQRCPPHLFLIAQEIGLTGFTDSELLEWAAANGCIVVSYDAASLPPSAWERVARGQSFSGVLIVGRSLPVSAVIDDLILIACASRAAEWRNRVTHLPL